MVFEIISGAVNLHSLFFPVVPVVVEIVGVWLVGDFGRERPISPESCLVYGRPENTVVTIFCRFAKEKSLPTVNISGRVKWL